MVQSPKFLFNIVLLVVCSQFVFADDVNTDFEFGTLEHLARLGEVMVYKHGGSWECMDHERDVINLNNLWDTKKAFWKVW